MDERLGTAVPEDATERHALGGVPLHVVEAAMLHDRIPVAFVDMDS
jgi:hypothetical protein